MFKHFNEPVINTRSINCTVNKVGYHLSYNPSVADYGSHTTALVLLGRVFFVLNGNHKEYILEASEKDGLQGCIDYFIDNIKMANDLSEHYIIIGQNEDLFELTKTALQSIGQVNIDRIYKAVKDK